MNKEAIKDYILMSNSGTTVVLDCSRVSSVDFTTATVFKAMIVEFEERGQSLVFYHTHSSVARAIVGACSDDAVIVQCLDDLYSHVNCKYH